MSKERGERIPTPFGQQLEIKGVRLPEGTQILEPAPEAGSEYSHRLALDLARKGASDVLVDAIAGPGAAQTFRDHQKF